MGCRLFWPREIENIWIFTFRIYSLGKFDASAAIYVCNRRWLVSGYDIITKGHNGRLMVESVEGKGAIFVIQWPTE